MPQDIRKVEQYAWQGYIARDLRENLAEGVDLDAVLRAQLEAQMERQGYVPLSGTFEVRYLDHRDPDNPPWWFTAEGREVLDETDTVTVRTSMRCYKADPTATS